MALHRPELVILDDPALGLDPIMRKQFNRDLITHLQGEGRTVFYSSHLLYEVEPVADEIAILDEGEIVRQTDTDSLRADASEHAIVQINLFGDDENPGYYYGYALRKDDHFYLWAIQSDKLVKLIKEKELNSVIDHGDWATHITADSKKLLEMLKENSGTLASKRPGIYKLKQ